MDTNASRRRSVIRTGLLVIGLALCLPNFFSSRAGKTGDPDRARLVAAVGPRRLLHGRPAGGFAFGPEPSPKRGVVRIPDVPFEVLRVSADLRSHFDADPTPPAAGNLALAYLLTGDAVKGVRLAELRTLQQETPEALIDLSAAYLQSAADDGALDPFARAYDAALRALRSDPTRREALFDRAMAADGLGLAWIARQAWDEYLAADPEGPWSEIAREARARAASREAENDRGAHDRPRMLAAWAAGDFTTVKEIAGRRQDLARELLRREGISAVAQAKIDGRPVAPILARALELNDMAERTDGDSLDREALAALDHGDLELAAAHVEFARASQALDDRQVEAGSPGVLHAAAVFKRKGSPYSAQAELQSALVEFFHGRRDGLVGRYTAMLGRHAGRYPLLRARALWMRGLCLTFVASDQWQAFLDRREAFKILTDARQPDAARQIATQLRASLARLGRDGEADALLGNVLASLSLADAPLRVYVAVESLTEDLKAKGLATAALEIRSRSEAGLRGTTPMLRVNAALEMVELAGDLNDRAAAVRSIAWASRALNQIADGEVRAEEQTVLDLAALAAGLPADPRAMAAERLIDTLRARKNEVYLQRALTLLGEQHLAAGRPWLGEPALREALALQFASRFRTEGEFERIKQFEEAERPADDLVGLLAATGRPDEALSLIEQLRNPEASTTGPSRPLSIAVPRGQAVVSYWTLKDRVLATVFNAQGVHHLSLPVGRPLLRSMVRRLQGSIDVECDALVAASLGELYQALVRPLLPVLGPAQRVAIVPDRDVWDVPFAGLAPTSRAEPLASRYEISFVSSLSAFTHRSGVWTTPRSVLAVGNPAWDRSAFADLEPLPESLAEARGVAGLYERSRVLSGTEATRASLERLAPGFDVVHVATHAVGNERDPGESFILLSADGSDPGMWRASDPGWEALSEARLVVLAACRTGNQRSRFGGASLGVLRSIQRATKAQTLVSTGDVDDVESRRLLQAFHRHLLAGQTPAAALRQAQIDGYRKGSGPTWMLYRVIT